MNSGETMLKSEEMKAHVENGQIVLDEPMDLPDGTRLRVVPDEDEAMAPDIKAAWQAEVQRRKQRLEAGETSTQPWEEVEAELMSL